MGNRVRGHRVFEQTKAEITKSVGRKRRSKGLHFEFPGFIQGCGTLCCLCSQWQRFIDCDQRPRATVESEVNTFITEYEGQASTDINAIMENAKAAGELIDALENAEALAREQGNTAEIKRCARNLRSLKQLLHQHVDRGTMQLMQRADELGEEQRGGGKAAQVSLHAPCVHGKGRVFTAMAFSALRSCRTPLILSLWRCLSMFPLKWDVYEPLILRIFNWTLIYRG